MGCTNSSTKDNNSNATNDMPDDAKAFMKLANDEKHPVARHILQEWNLFVKKQIAANEQQNGTPVHHNVGVDGGEVWATTPQNPVTHKSVDEVGQTFLHYLRADLCKRHWGGNFNYSVAGVTVQGFIVVTADINMVSQTPRDISTFKLQLHYNTPVAGQNAPEVGRSDNRL